MAWESKHGDITVFANKKTKPNQPDWRGKIFLDGKEYEIALWNKQTKVGATFLAGRMGDEVKVKQDNTVNIPAASKTSPIDDDLPW